ncbi:hypothetical protein BMR1_03g01155 [Babesia microti strain RI]|uniref:Uncharacterized protein n=1 Tax=Babesia microti (strain RI) TaxID=1133968 RepID=A0A1R4ABK1_BABMR|nr:hypothetical protein BMR1_03g01155 [Babesia microti strain RI]SJK86314.1 hypothetical protein BMR1_03g01155 [Babesia microti strain RI]|eukprot:XP_021338487.1 hypothetical protein BMR1_03g01155 [Babesia microti strain RI]
MSLKNNYRAVQTHFNNCLREFYEARRSGKLYYYVLPGLLLTHTNYKRTPPHINRLLDTSVWFPSTNISKLSLQSDCKHDNTHNHVPDALNILHVSPDFNVNKRIIAYSHSNAAIQRHVIFTNSYHLEFLSLIESAKFYDINQHYQNLRLITGSYCTFHLIFYEKLFHYAFLYITKVNYRNLLRLNVIRSLHNCLHPFCKLIFITEDPEISKILCRHSESLNDLDDKVTNPLMSLLSNLSNKFVPEFEAHKYFTGINFQGLSTLMGEKFYSVNNKIVSEYDFTIADYMHQHTVNGNKLRDRSDNLSNRFCHKYYRIDKNIPNLRLVKPVSM